LADHRRALGAAGEAAAARHYEMLGYEIVERNWRNHAGEIDLVLADPRVLVFCEVKTRRTSTFGDPAEAVTWTKQQRLKKLALGWLDEHSARGRSLRLDVAAVIANTDGTFTVEIISDIA